MATYKYGSWVGGQATGKVSHRAFLAYTLSTNNATTYKLTVSSGVDLWNSKWTSVNTTCDLTGRTAKYIDLTTTADKYTFFSSQAFTYTKGHSAVKKTIYATSKVTGVDASAGGTSVNGKTSTASYTFTVPAKTHYTVTYHGNATGVSGVPSAQTKWYGETLTLSSTKPTRGGYAFAGWATSSNGSVEYKAGSKYTDNANLNLYAKWTVTNPPTCTTKVTTPKLRKGITSDKLIVNISNVKKYTGRSISSIKVTCNGVTKTGTTAKNYTFTNSEVGGVGTKYISVTITDSAGAYTTYPKVGSVQVVAPTWTKKVTVSGVLPALSSTKYAIFDSVQVYNYTAGAYQSATTSGYKITDNKNGTWSTTITLNENQVPSKSATVNLSAHPIKFSYKHYDTNVSEADSAFYTTSRNQNYSNGIYNVMFVSGCDSEAYPNYTSRVWWSKINDPLYFPDTNYIEVGSNDTAVQGLTKVGDYLAVIKQSKTTDTAIFLLYPTSFEEETTYAVKQGVQGVGALSRYSFNILGDETLFLSPKGVMAVVPTQDEEHKVQNRSYFVDKRLLAEDGIENAYSFVYDGKYYLAIGNGHVYVLDGNQRNSWGNDRTVLVYECYYLENVPANCFVKFNDALVFSNDEFVGAFGEGYLDERDMETGEETPVKAEWSTIFDDDGSLHYYKTMQKKGNLVSILPLDSETGFKSVEIDEETFNEDKTKYYTLVDDEYIQCTEEDEFVGDFAEVEIDEETFNENKTKYYTIVSVGGFVESDVDEETFNEDKTSYYYIYNDEYVQCTDDDVYDPDTQYYYYTYNDEYVQCTEEDEYDADTQYFCVLGVYYVIYHSSTKVFVRKDDKEPVEIERKFGRATNVPSEMFLNKKFKKYKRLQFIIRNEEDENFGVDEIVKNYTVGNYAKK